MAKLTLSSMGSLLREKRGTRGIREVANDIGVSSATLSRVENGKQPDLETFTKICKWLEVDPRELLGCAKAATETGRLPEGDVVYAHLRAERNLSREAVNALAEMILRAQEMMSKKL